MSIEIQTRSVTGYKAVIITMDGHTLDLGLLDATEAQDLAWRLVSAAEQVIVNPTEEMETALHNAVEVLA